MVADALLINLALVTALFVRFAALVAFNPGRPLPAAELASILSDSVGTFGTVSPFLTLLLLVVFWFSGFYGRGRTYRARYKAILVFRGVTLGYLSFAAVTYLVFNVIFGRAAWFPRSVWLVSWMLTLGLLGGARLGGALWQMASAREAERAEAGSRSIRKIVVIGGAGYIGSLVVRKLLSRGYTVSVLDAFLYGDQSLRDVRDNPSLEITSADLRNMEAVVRSLNSVDAVVHLAALVGDPACALDERLTLEINLAATRMIAEAARGLGVRRFVFASTCSVYGASDELLDERSALNPLSLYARTKLQCERILLALGSDTFAPVVVRFGTLYGISPRPRFDLVVNLLTAQAVRDGRCAVFGGDQWRPFLHVDDAAESVVAMLEAPEEAVRGEIFNVGSDGENLQLSQLGELVQAAVPGATVDIRSEVAERRNYRVCFEKIRRAVSFMPRHTVAQGIEEMKQALLDDPALDYQDRRCSNYKTLLEDSAVGIYLTAISQIEDVAIPADLSRAIAAL